MNKIPKDLQFYKFSAYGFLKNLRFFETYLILFFLEMGINYVQIGTLMAIREVATHLLELPTGIIADCFGRKRSMIFSFIAYIISFLIFSFLPGFVYYILAMLFFAFGEAFRTGTHKAMILSYLQLKGIEDLKVHYYGYTRSASQLGSAISSLIAMAMVFSQGSFRWIFLFSVLPYITDLLLMISYPNELDGEVSCGSEGMMGEMKDRLGETFKNFLKLFTKEVTVRALLSSSVFNGLFKGTKDYLQPLIKNYALSLPLLVFLSGDQRSVILIGLVYFILFFLTAYASRKSGYLVDQIKSLPLGINLSYVTGCVFLLLSGIFLKINFPIISILCFFLFYLLQSLKKPMNVSYISEQISSTIMATGLSGESQLKHIFAAVYSFLMGLMVHYTGLGTSILLISLLSIMVFPLVRIKEKI
jgi:MFS family permease